LAGLARELRQASALAQAQVLAPEAARQGLQGK